VGSTWLRAALAVVLASTSAAARADDDTPETLLRIGVALRREHRNEEALDEFHKALSLAPTPIALAQVALAEQALGRWLDAERDLRGALDVRGDDWIERNRASLEGARDEVAAHLGWLTVHVDRTGAGVQVNHAPAAAGVEERVDAGPCLVEVSLGPALRAVRHIDVAAGEHETTAVTLGMEAPPAEPAPLPTAAPPSPVVARADPVAAPAPAPAVRHEGPTGPLVLVGTGAALAGLGAALGVRTFTERHARDAACAGGSCALEAMQHDANARQAAIISDVAFGASLASMAAGAVWWFGSRALPAQRRGETLGPYVLGALGLLSLGATAYLGVRVLDLKGDRDQACSAAGCAPVAETYDLQARTCAALATIGAVTGAGLLAGGVTWMVVDRARVRVGTFAPAGGGRAVAGFSMEGGFP
jgi:hypothetical protein